MSVSAVGREIFTRCLCANVFVYVCVCVFVYLPDANVCVVVTVNVGVAVGVAVSPVALDVACNSVVCVISHNVKYTHT